GRIGGTNSRPMPMLSWMPLRAGLEGIHGGRIGGTNSPSTCNMLSWMPLRAGLEGIHGGRAGGTISVHMHHALMDALARRPIGHPWRTRWRHELPSTAQRPRGDPGNQRRAV